MASRRRAFRITLLMPDGVNEDMMIDYITKAVRSYCGGLEQPSLDTMGDPLATLDRTSVVVRWPAKFD